MALASNLSSPVAGGHLPRSVVSRFGHRAGGDPGPGPSAPRARPGRPCAHTRNARTLGSPSRTPLGERRSGRCPRRSRTTGSAPGTTPPRFRLAVLGRHDGVSGDPPRPRRGTQQRRLDPKMTSTSHLPALGVLVGYDGSEGGERALLWGANAAAEAEVALYITTALPPGSLGRRGRHGDPDEVRRGAHAMVVHAAAKVRAAHPHLVVESSLSEGRAADVILETSRRADLIVVGSRGHGGFAG